MTELLIKLFIKDKENVENGSVREKYGTFSSIVGITVNALLAAIKMLAGILSGSLAILADGINNLSDAGSSGVTFISFKIASKPADRDHPFGHARIEYIASLIVSFLILNVGFDLLVDSVSKIFGFSETSPLNVKTITIVILSVSILMKLWLALFYTKISKKIGSSVIKAAAADSLSDSISTTAVLASSIIVWITDIVIIDSIVGLGVSVLILIAGAKILLENKNLILGEAPVESTVKAIEDIVNEYPEIVGIHDMLVHNYGPGHYIASFHAEVNGEDDIFELHDTIDNIEKRISHELNIQCTIHLDPIVVNDETINALKEIALEGIKKIDERISMHDFRAVIGTTHTNLIFDIVLPFESKLSPEEAKCKIEKAIQEIKEDTFCVITVDRG
ncbi:MAG: cation transporter [Clostridia bacterium]|nr:cation transporter [Clostridia bacterium]